MLTGRTSRGHVTCLTVSPDPEPELQQRLSQNPILSPEPAGTRTLGEPWTQNPGPRTLGEPWTQNPGPRTLDPEPWENPGPRTLDPEPRTLGEPWTQNPGRTLDPEPWTQNPEPWENPAVVNFGFI